MTEGPIYKRAKSVYMFPLKAGQILLFTSFTNLVSRLEQLMNESLEFCAR